MEGSIRATDTVARQGGDEFIIVLSELNEPDSVEHIVQTILHKVSQPFQLEDQTVDISASIGIAFYPQDAKDADQLMKNADQAMYVAKNLGGNQARYFTHSMQAKPQC